MTNFEIIVEELRSSGAELVTALQSTGDIKLKSFERLDLAARQLALRLKGAEQLPRQVMNDLYITAKVLENEAQHSKDSALVGHMASTLFMTFDLILLGESHDDRRAGVPRVR